MIHHGFEKLNDINNFANAFVMPLHLPFPVTLSYIAAASEIGGSWLLITGLATRFGAAAILGTMTVAIYHALITSGFNIYLIELLALYFSSNLLIIFIGPGTFSLDYLIIKLLNNKFNFSESISNKIVENESRKTLANSNQKLISKNAKKNSFFPFSSYLSP